MQTSRSIELLKDPGFGFPAKPRLIADLDLFCMPDGLGIQVRGSKSPVVLRGRLFAEIDSWLRLLDGSRTLEDLLDSCPDETAKNKAANLLLTLFRRGLLAPGQAPPAGLNRLNGVAGTQEGDEVLRRQMLLWGRKISIAGNDTFAEEVQHKLLSTNIALIGSGIFGTTTFDVLNRSGCTNIQVADWSNDGLMASSVCAALDIKDNVVPRLANSIDEATSWLRKVLPNVDLLVTATRNAPESLFQAVNALCLGHKCQWLRGNDDSSNIEIGPFVAPFRSACFACYALRRTSTAEYAIEEELYQQHLADDAALLHKVGQGESISHATASGAVLAGEVVRIITMISPPAALNAVLTVTFGGTFELSKFMRVPRCPECYRGKTSTTLEPTKSI